MHIRDILEQIDLSEKGKLCPKIWNGTELKSDVHKTLVKIVDDFIEFLDVDKKFIKDVVLTGSIANYTWHEGSDVDVHIILHDEGIKCHGIDTDDYWDTKRQLWNLQHDITIHGLPVEFFVETSKLMAVSTGIYSIQDDDWAKQPRKSNPSIDDKYVTQKAATFAKELDALLDDDKASQAKFDKMKVRIKRYRTEGLKRDGEFSVENLVYKILRSDGYVKRLFDTATKAYDKSMSIE